MEIGKPVKENISNYFRNEANELTINNLPPELCSIMISHRFVPWDFEWSDINNGIWLKTKEKTDNIL